MKIIRVSASVSYDVIISQGILDRAGEYFDRALNVVNEDRPRIAIVSDDKVFSLYGRRLIEALKGYDTVEFVFPNGEKSKNLHTYCELQEYLAGRHLGRGDVIAALGGGVVGDLAGFAAATYLRGIRFIQIPTTLQQWILRQERISAVRSGSRRQCFAILIFFQLSATKSLQTVWEK